MVEPAIGEVVDGGDLARRLVEELRDGTGPVRLDAPGELREPTVGAAALEAVRPAAERAISAPVTLTHPADGPDVEASCRIEGAEVDATSSGPYDRVEGDVRDGFDIDFGRITTYPDGSERHESWFHRYQPQDEDDAGGEAEADEGS